MTAAAIGDDKLFSARFDIKKDVCFAAFIPPFPLLTSFARACMPKVVPLSDAVYNLSRCSLLCSAFALGRYELLSEATKDKLHQPYRLGLIEGGAKVFEMANSLGAFATFISGAGSTVLSAVPADNAEFFEKIETVLASDAQTAVFEVKRLEADNVGATVEKTNGFN